MADYLQINDGGPAFPDPIAIRPDGVVLPSNSAGMSLRDWFAGQALNGLIASEDDEMISIAPGGTIEDALARKAKRRAEWCYAQADAMLAARVGR